MKHENISQWGRSVQNGLNTGRRPSLSNAEVNFPAAFRSRIWVVRCWLRASKSSFSQAYLLRETFWTAPSLRTRDKTLLRIICNICSKDREDLSSSAIAAKYVNARLAGVDEWTKHVPHAVVIKLPFCVSAILLLSEEMVERCCWKIAKQDCQDPDEDFPFLGLMRSSILCHIQFPTQHGHLTMEDYLSFPFSFLLYSFVFHFPLFFSFSSHASFPDRWVSAG